jgi:hypothetical protein
LESFGFRLTKVGSGLLILKGKPEEEIQNCIISKAKVFAKGSSL